MWDSQHYIIVCPWANLHMSTESRVHVPSLEHTRVTASIAHIIGDVYLTVVKYLNGWYYMHILL